MADYALALESGFAHDLRSSLVSVALDRVTSSISTNAQSVAHATSRVHTLEDRTELERVRLEARMSRLEDLLAAVKSQVDKVQRDAVLVEDTWRKALSTNQTEFTAKFQDLSRREQDHAHEFGAGLQKLEGSLAALGSRHESLARSIAGHRDEQAKRESELGYSLSKAQQKHVALEKFVNGHHAEASRRVDKLSAAVDKLQQDLKGDVSKLGGAMKDRLAALDGQLQACAHQLPPLTARIDQCHTDLKAQAQLAQAHRQQLDRLHRDTDALGGTLTKELETLRLDLTAQVKEQDTRHCQQVLEASGACQELSAKQQGLADDLAGGLGRLENGLDIASKRQDIADGLIAKHHEESVRRLSKLSGALDDTAKSASHAISKHADETSHRLGALDGQLDAYSRQLRDVGAYASSLVQQHIAESKTQLEQEFSNQSTSVEQKFQLEIGTFVKRVGALEHFIKSKFQEASGQLQREVDQEVERVRQMLGQLFTETHENVTKFQEFMSTMENANQSAAKLAGDLDAAHQARAQQQCEPLQLGPAPWALPRKSRSAGARRIQRTCGCRTRCWCRV